MTLFMISRLPCSKELYESVLPYVEVTRSGEIRRQAFRALKIIEPYPATGVLSNFLRRDEPELQPLIRALCMPGLYGERPSLLNIAMVGPSLSLAEMNLTAERSASVPPFSGDLTGDVLGLLTEIYHPSFLPMMIEWAGDENVRSSRYAGGRLERMLGIEHGKFDLTGVRAWWRKADPVLSRAYDFSSPNGLDDWLKAWATSEDPLTRRMLSHLWDFQQIIPEISLLEACEGTYSTAAKALLSDLWEKKRLSPGTRMSLVKTYFKMRLVEDTTADLARAPAKSIWLKYDVQFPFPEAASVSWNTDFANNREPVLRGVDSASGLNLHYPIFPREVSRSADRPTKGLVEIWECDALGSPQRELWKLRWELDSSKPNFGSAREVKIP